uniref:PXA domain-containing protein n=1 Tax=Oreochromis niloticus TaxID=8128 RepID=A0A669AV98_ORENI
MPRCTLRGPIYPTIHSAAVGVDNAAAKYGRRERPKSELSKVSTEYDVSTYSYQQELFPLDHSCAVCGKIKCKRHRPTLLLENYQPWLDLKIPSKVDASLSEILELVLENFVYPWYRDITDHEAFVDELRVTLRFSAAVLVRRTQKVKLRLYKDKNFECFKLIFIIFK